MDLKWVVLTTLMVFAIKAFSSEIVFKEVIDETYKSQMQLAQEIHRQTIGSQRKTPESITVSQAIYLEGSILKVY